MCVCVCVCVCLFAFAVALASLGQLLGVCSSQPCSPGTSYTVQSGFPRLFATCTALLPLQAVRRSERIRQELFQALRMFATDHIKALYPVRAGHSN